MLAPKAINAFKYGIVGDKLTMVWIFSSFSQFANKSMEYAWYNLVDSETEGYFLSFTADLFISYIVV